jgi:hypothetical protein
VSSLSTRKPALRVNSDGASQGPGSVSVYCLGPEFFSLLAGAAHPLDLLKSVFRVTVARETSADDDRLPNVSGRYLFLEDEIQFVPTFPYERDLKYRASFDLSSLESCPTEKPATIEFAIPSEPPAVALPVVAQIFPSCDVLPENLLRFYVHFSHSMQRGRALDEISLLDSGGRPLADALYRPPVELWDRALQRLTVLLDPGRLKRRMGPNLALGPPLKAGRHYILEIGSGMIDLHGRPLHEPFRKRFLAADPVRVPIPVKDWQLHRPATRSREALTLTFSSPLDRALLFETIRIESEDGSLIEGQLAVDECETRWSLTPASPWMAGVYRVRVNSHLEDVCGNTPTGAFDRPVRGNPDTITEPARSSFTFRLV